MCIEIKIPSKASRAKHNKMEKLEWNNFVFRSHKNHEKGKKEKQKNLGEFNYEHE